MSETKLFLAGEEVKGHRLDVFLVSCVKGLTRSQAQKSIEAGMVKVSGLERKAGYRLREGEVVSVEEEVKPEPSRLEPQDIPLRIIYSDPDIIIIDKPSGLVVHPGAGVISGTLANALLFHFPEIAEIGRPDRPGIVHRLDKDTSGVMVAARSVPAYMSLTSQFKKRLVKKTYLALAWGRFGVMEGKYDWPIGRHVNQGCRISIHTRAPKEAETFFQVLKIFKETTFLEMRPVTGRTHQIRVHLAAAGHPIVGDPLYGKKKEERISPRLFLHANILSIIHPATGERMEFGSPLPYELEEVLAKQVRISA